MISTDEYLTLVRAVIDRDLESNPPQRNAVYHEGQKVLLLAAGPGSGKTTVLVLRALRHTLVDDILPEHILLTTFTRKAAKELRTRWLDWGTLLLAELKNDPRFGEEVDRIDLNRCRIDTLDSIAQQTLTENRFPGEVAPVLAPSSASRLILKRSSFSTIYTANKNELDDLLSRYSFDGELPRNRGEALSIAKTLCERLVQDCVDLTSFAAISQAHKHIVEILLGYSQWLFDSNVYDFATFERRLFERLQEGSLSEWIANVQALLIDEYQDTNPLQESLYFEVISQSNSAVTVVGDDDQSMYRFRGGSVELFTKFPERCLAATARQTHRIDMIANYRSSAEIISFYNSHILGDPGFAKARIVPAKGEVTSQRGPLGMPVLGMFRQTPAALANSLASWLQQLFENRQIAIGPNESDFLLTVSEAGDLGDCVVLAHSIEEVRYDRYDRSSEPRFAGYFRQEMMRRGMNVFNPRGRSLRSVSDVQQLLGVLLLCVDPDGLRTDQVFPTNEARFFLTEWRNAGASFIAQNPKPSSEGGLSGFVDSWQRVSRGLQDEAFPPDWPALELVFKLITWIPGFQGDPEHQVWLEAITRTIASSGMGSPYGMQILQIRDHLTLSRESLIRDALVPIAENEVEVDEDIMPSVPRHYLQMMTIHQSKGLEFPLVIVDVGSHFTRNSPSQEFLRFPRGPSNVVVMEDDVEAHLQSPLRSARTPIDRSFDDLARLYYVAYSRPQSVLILVGCESCLKYGRGPSLEGAIPNIALGWNRNRNWPWRQAYTGRRRPVRVDVPFYLI
jgi:DNA helicase II / ATP-dependent DNA helicase PcrA